MATSESLKTTATLPQQTAETTTPSKLKETFVGFTIGGLAACGAVTFTNPLEV